jgi:hypothetical protein
MITLKQAKQLKRREVLLDQFGKRWYVNGEVKTWKRDPNRTRVPLKHGLYVYSAIDTLDFVNGECSWFTLENGR